MTKTTTMTAHQLFRHICDRCERFDDEVRLCDVCGRLVIDGYYIFGDTACSDDCRKGLISDAEYDEYTSTEEYEDGSSPYYDELYWTEWGDLEGKLLELAEAMSDSGIDWRSDAVVPEELVKQALDAIEDDETRRGFVPYLVDYANPCKTEYYLHMTRDLSLEEMEAFCYYVVNVTQDASPEALEAFKREYVGYFTNPFKLGMHVIRKRIEAGELTEEEAGDLQPWQIAQDIFCGIADGYHNLNGYIFKEA